MTGRYVDLGRFWVHSKEDGSYVVMDHGVEVARFQTFGEAAADVCKRQGGKPSRPGLMRGAMNTEQISFRIPIELKRRVEDETKQRGETITAFVREALEQELIRSARLRVELARPPRTYDVDETMKEISERIGIDLTKEDP